jgi:hypothetical protein
LRGTVTSPSDSAAVPEPAAPMPTAGTVVPPGTSMRAVWPLVTGPSTVVVPERMSTAPKFARWNGWMPEAPFSFTNARSCGAPFASRNAAMVALMPAPRLASSERIAVVVPVAATAKV